MTDEQFAARLAELERRRDRRIGAMSWLLAGAWLAAIAGAVVFA